VQEKHQKLLKEQRLDGRIQGINSMALTTSHGMMQRGSLRIHLQKPGT
jgi:hypothetical protein